MAPRPLDLRVIDHWEAHQEVLSGVEGMPKGHIEELIDAIPMGCYPNLVAKLKQLSDAAIETVPTTTLS